MITRFYFKACFCFAMLSLIATLSSSPAYTAPHIAPTQAPSSSTPTTLTGWLTAVWADGLPGTPSLAPVYRLTENSGRAYQLQLDSSLVTPQLLGQQVTLAGQFLTERSAEAEPIFEVTELEPAASADPTAAEDDVLGRQPWVSIMCKFPDVAEPEHDLAYFEGMYATNQYPSMDHYWRELSYNQMNLNGSTAVGWYTLPHPFSYYVSIEGSGNTYTLFQDCVNAADPDVDFTQFVGINLMFNEFMNYAIGGTNWADLDGESRTWRTTWLPLWAYENSTIVAHEMGHSFGLPHSMDSEGDQHGNPWDVMSNSWDYCHVLTDPTYGCLGQHTIGLHKEMLGWISAEQKQVVQSGEQATFTLESLALIPENSNPLLIKLPLGIEPTFKYITIEARRPVGYDQKTPGPAVVLHRTESWGAATLITSLTVGESYIDPHGQITVTVTSETATGFVVDITYAPYSCAKQTAIPQSECEALLTFYNSLDGENWDWKFNWFYGSPCNWYGVYCEDGHVTQLGYVANRLKGELPSELANLVYLTHLYLSDNPISGSIPLFLTTMPNLRYLYLINGNLTGLIPPELGEMEGLIHLTLSGHQLEGPIPAELGNLSSLEWLILANNQLTGTIDASIFQLNSLYELNLSGNQLEGTIPLGLTNLPLLSVLNLSHNQFSGTIPPEIEEITTLQFLNLSGNQLTGEIPTTLENLAYLGHLDLAENQLTGAIPTGLNDLAHLDLHDNLLTGSIPAFSPYLYELNLAHNQLTGTIPPQLFTPYLRTLNLAHNNLTGVIPPEMAQTINLDYLDLSENQLEGSLPAYPHLYTFYYLDVSHNQLGGELPFELTHYRYLNHLDLGYNAFSAHNTALRAYLQQFDPDWEETQTTPPTSIQVTPQTAGTVLLSWQHPLYQADGGYYEISYATSPSGPFTVYGITADKRVASYVVEELQPETMYYFRMRTFTPAHDLQQNELWSDYSHLAFVPVAEVYLPIILQP